MVKSKFELYTKVYELKYNILEIKILKTQDKASGYIFHLQGNYNLSIKKFSNALRDFLESARCYLSIKMLRFLLNQRQ